MKNTKIKFAGIFIINIILIVLFIGLHLYFNHLADSGATLEEQIKNEIIKKDSLATMKKDLGESADYAKIFDGFFIGKDENDVADFISKIESLSSSSSLKISISSVGYEDSADISKINGQYVNVRLSAIGRWDNIQYLITYLQNESFKLTVKSITLNSNSDKTWTASIDFTVPKYKN